MRPGSSPLSPAGLLSNKKFGDCCAMQPQLVTSLKSFKLAHVSADSPPTLPFPTFPVEIQKTTIPIGILRLQTSVFLYKTGHRHVYFFLFKKNIYHNILELYSSAARKPKFVVPRRNSKCARVHESVAPNLGWVGRKPSYYLLSASV